MNRAQLEHVIRAAATIAGDTEIVVIGSQAILGQYPDAPAELLVSADVDVYPRNHPDRADLIEGSIGELSPFHGTYGYYAQASASSPTTSSSPSTWGAGRRTGTTSVPRSGTGSSSRGCSLSGWRPPRSSRPRASASPARSRPTRRADLVRPSCAGCVPALARGILRFS